MSGGDRIGKSPFVNNSSPSKIIFIQEIVFVWPGLLAIGKKPQLVENLLATPLLAMNLRLSISHWWLS